MHTTTLKGNKGLENFTLNESPCSQDFKTVIRLVRRLPVYDLEVFEITQNCRVREQTAAILKVEYDIEVMT